MDPEVLYLPQMSIECELWGTFVEFQQMVCPTSTNKIKFKKKKRFQEGSNMCQQNQEFFCKDKGCPYICLKMLPDLPDRVQL